VTLEDGERTLRVHDVFICYAFEDASSANTVCASLEEAGIRCWIAPRNALPGIPYGRQLVEAIASCPVVLLIFSSNANVSRAVLNELELATNRDKIIVPIRLEDITPSTDLEFYIRSIHWHDATTSLANAMPALTELVGALVQKGPVTGVSPRPHHSAAQRRHNLGSELTSFVGRSREIRDH
jgi:hypothetical protein